MPLREFHRRQLVARLQELRRDRPIDNVQIERALVAILEALLDEADCEPLPGEIPALLTGADLGR
jgi:hypothetical protein